MHILFAGGGTAGHINPALAVADYIKEKHPDAKISYIGTPTKLEAKLVPQKGYDFYPVSVSGFQRKMNFSAIKHNAIAAKQAVTASFAAKKLLKRLKPDVVVGTGGYVSGPVLREAAKLGIKTAIHEQNAYPGVTNKMLSGVVDRVMLAMPEAKKQFKKFKKMDVTGNPVRGELALLNKKQARARLNIKDDLPLVLSFGGSLGARRINESVEELMRYNVKEKSFYQIHAAGRGGYKVMKDNLSDIKLGKNIDLREYINDMDVCLAAADLVVCRAGAITLSELSFCGKASLLIPSPYVSENHQFHNAMTLKNAGAAEIIEEKDLSGQKLINTVVNLMNNPGLLSEMGAKAQKCSFKSATETIYNIIMELYTA